MADVLILIHGMITDRGPLDLRREYGVLLDNLALYQVRRSDFTRVIEVEWGSEPIPEQGDRVPLERLRRDQVIARAEETLYRRFRSGSVREDRSPQNHRLTGGSALFDLRALPLRDFSTHVKDSSLLLGITDALYYASLDGQYAMRATVYSQILEGLASEAVRDAEEVRLFIIAHSLGVTVAHDFLYGLFQPDPEYTPGFYQNQLVPSSIRDAYRYWRTQAQGTETDGRKRLQVGAFVTAGSQLPLMMMRRQHLVERLARDEYLDPTEIGIPDSGPVKWRNFYDVDDILGFPCRRLYKEVPTIEDHQVDTAALPGPAHIRYWENEKVRELTGGLLLDNLKR